MRHPWSWFMAEVIVIIVLTPVVTMVVLAMDRIYAVLALLSLPFLLAYELMQRKAEEAALAERELDLLQLDHPDVPRHMLEQARRETLMQRRGHAVDVRPLERVATAQMRVDTAGNARQTCRADALVRRPLSPARDRSALHSVQR